MKKEIRNVDKKLGIVQVTTADERWYIRPVTSEKSGLPEYKYVPSVTWICDFYPKGVEFYKWMASKGWDESQAIKEAAGTKGDKIHQGVYELSQGNVIKIDSKLLNKDTGEAEEISLEEYEALMSFVAWTKEAKPKFLKSEFVVFNDAQGYAGTIDMEVEIAGEKWIVDIKSSASIYPSHEIQLSAYKHAGFENHKIGILQVGYRRNKNKYKFTEIRDKFAAFLAAQTIWANETEGAAPSQKDYPLELKLA
jgi:hypothetical protein